MTQTVHGLPPLLQPGLQVAVVPPPLKSSRWQTVEAASGEGGSGQLVSLSGSSSIADADALVGKTLLARIEDLPPDYLRHDADALIGREVVDVAHGALGSVAEVLTGVANDVWVINGPFGEVLVAAVDEVIVELGPSGPVLVRVPDGTIDGM